MIMIFFYRQTRTVTYITAMLATLMSSCSRDMPINEGDISKTVRLDIDATICQNQDTKAAITGDNFSNGATIGLFVCRNDDYEKEHIYTPHMVGMDNIRATFNGSSWKYNTSSNPDIDINILAITSKAKTNADVYAYSPWIKDIANPEAILYDVTSQADLMYAEENKSRTNCNIDPNPNTGTAVDDSYTIHLRFHHALSILRVGVRLARYGYNNPSLSKVTVRRASDEVATKLYSAATFNSIEGTFDSNTLINTSQISSSSSATISSTSNYSYVNTLLIPTQVIGNDELEIVLNVNGVPLTDIYKIKVEDVTKDGEIGFKANRIYTFLFTIDNYLRLVPDNIIISDEWPEEAIPDRYI